MSRFAKQPNPEQLVASIIALAEQSNNLALDAAMEAARADAVGETATVVDQVCRLAVGVGVACGEISWLVSELETLEPEGELLAEAGVAVAAMETSIRAVADAIQEVADRGAPIEVLSSAEALRRVGTQLAELLPRLQREFCG
jgi:methyl-accepting chemotaxis protein